MVYIARRIRDLQNILKETKNKKMRKRLERSIRDVVCNFLESCDFGPTSHSPPIGHHARDFGEPRSLSIEQALR